ncbi:hypothetical protein COA17_16585 [Sphingomonas ginsenosidimutans]|jgi:hypothetical protein|uniref:Uncharacterized protein n=1 Tax=Sphingomonas ginsenosidimutans TaxID=862134 RepID=A0A2A4HSB1_9SPHN|nr:hypothetical protein COA17_16585 [Sphingomonas ginsenosidimutans]
MPAQRRRAPRGRPRRAAPRALPDDLYAYGDDPAPPRRNPSPDALDIGKLSVFDDWPDSIPVTVTEVDIFERYFGDVLDRLFHPVTAPQVGEPALH